MHGASSTVHGWQLSTVNSVHRKQSLLCTPYWAVSWCCNGSGMLVGIFCMPAWTTLCRKLHRDYTNSKNKLFETLSSSLFETSWRKWWMLALCESTRNSPEHVVETGGAWRVQLYQAPDYECFLAGEVKSVETFATMSEKQEIQKRCLPPKLENLDGNCVGSLCYLWHQRRR